MAPARAPFPPAPEPVLRHGSRVPARGLERRARTREVKSQARRETGAWVKLLYNPSRPSDEVSFGLDRNHGRRLPGVHDGAGDHAGVPGIVIVFRMRGDGRRRLSGDIVAILARRS